MCRIFNMIIYARKKAEVPLIRTISVEDNKNPPMV